MKAVIEGHVDAQFTVRRAQLRQIEDFGDNRNKGWCVYCGGPDETRDHVPSRVLLDEPYPPELPVLPACAACNRAFSCDEAYLACVIECALTGSVESAKARRKVCDMLTRSAALATRLAAARYERDGEIGFNPEPERVRAIILKLARGHAAFENNEPRVDDPESVRFAPITAMNESEREQWLGSLAGGRQSSDDEAADRRRHGPGWVDHGATRDVPLPCGLVRRIPRPVSDPGVLGRGGGLGVTGHAGNSL